MNFFYNNLFGLILDYFFKFSLEYFDLFYNYFEGRVLTNGVFVNVSVIFVVGNGRFCGGIF